VVGWRSFAKPGSGNGSVSTVTSSRFHRPSRAVTELARARCAPCTKDGRERGYGGGFKDGRRAG